MPITLLRQARSAETTGTSCLLVPVGSVEQHGPHLPLSTDTYIAVETCERAANALHRSGIDVSVAAPVEYGASGEHEGFPGTISIGHDAMRLLLVELGRSATRWVDRIILVSGHGGNVPGLIDATGLLRTEGRDVAWTTCAEADWDAHAGRSETSVMLAIAPHTVAMDLAMPGNTEPIEDLWPRLTTGGLIAVTESGILGDPTGANAVEGERLIEQVSTRVVRQILSRELNLDGSMKRPQLTRATS